MESIDQIQSENSILKDSNEVINQDSKMKQVILSKIKPKENETTSIMKIEKSYIKIQENNEQSEKQLQSQQDNISEQKTLSKNQIRKQQKKKLYVEEQKQMQEKSNYLDVINSNNLMFHGSFNSQNQFLPSQFIPEQIKDVSQPYQEYIQPFEDQILFKDCGKTYEEIHNIQKRKIGLVPKIQQEKQEEKEKKFLTRSDKNEQKMLDLGFAYIGNSQLTVWHRPTLMQVKQLKEQLGITMLVTVQRDSEKPEDVKQYCQRNGLKHMHIHLDGANKPLLENKKIQIQLRRDLKNLFKFMCENEEKVLLHCAAGIHRTGICTYTLLRWSGLGSKDAFDVIRGIREDTANGVGEWRIQLAEVNIV